MHYSVIIERENSKNGSLPSIFTWKRRLDNPKASKDAVQTDEKNNVEKTEDSTDEKQETQGGDIETLVDAMEVDSKPDKAEERVDGEVEETSKSMDYVKIVETPLPSRVIASREVVSSVVTVTDDGVITVLQPGQLRRKKPHTVSFT
jgi:hypothetical protein